MIFLSYYFVSKNVNVYKRKIKEENTSIYIQKERNKRKKKDTYCFLATFVVLLVGSTHSMDISRCKEAGLDIVFLGSCVVIVALLLCITPPFW